MLTVDCPWNSWVDHQWYGSSTMLGCRLSAPLSWKAGSVQMLTDMATVYPQYILHLDAIKPLMHAGPSC